MPIRRRQAGPFWHVTRQVFGDPVPKAEVTDLPPDQKYLNFESTIGIVSTPVIDDRTNTIYVVAQSKAGGAYRFRLHAFDLGSGREKTELHSPVKIEASYLGNGVGSAAPLQSVPGPGRCIDAGIGLCRHAISATTMKPTSGISLPSVKT